MILYNKHGEVITQRHFCCYLRKTNELILKSMSLNDRPSNQFNKASNCGVRATGGQLLSSAVSSSLSQH